MTVFAADWLSLREPHDARARNSKVLNAMAAWAKGRHALRIVDLGAGTGSARRALSSCLPSDCTWTLIEHDPRLIVTGEAQLEAGANAHYRRADLLKDLDSIFSEKIDLVTASALIDLVSGNWLEHLARHLRQKRCAAWIGLTYDGLLRFTPKIVGDRAVADAFNHDMTRDKGFGPALGPRAHHILADLLLGHGIVMEGSSPWLLGEEDQKMIMATVDGIADAALDVPEIGLWRSRRQSGTSAMEVGHHDLLFLP
ncbi:MAG TPA: class I SAM-dependent methyltransferase [Geminicoccus sp.]|jgi:hypothetical protein|uniref:class I SAM-dependent methyltransferase n=1 Tax=Geminicoccus sp. TaxID=2024832 RepID=UPI002E336A06|nr:class I SAM-dependent methyltransferase [Geminicoccus sp.]HEX2526305.1 class I SAM-dependent methyltransferase [Geminicoccus sp.]